MSATPPIPLGTFDPAGVLVTCGTTTLIGLAKGSFVKVMRDSPLTTDDVGANGDVVVIKNNDQRGSIEVEAMSSTPTNDFLSAQAATYELTGAGFFPVLVKDLSGRSIASGPQAWVEKVADADYSTESTTRAWKIRVGRLQHFVGGTV
jgi:hypothetical protein